MVANFQRDIQVVETLWGGYRGSGRTGGASEDFLCVFFGCWLLVWCYSKTFSEG